MTTAVAQASKLPTNWTGPRRYLPAVALGGVCVIAALSPVGDEEGQVLCPYRLATGGWCPGCGGTRAARAMIQGDLSHALSLNPWAMLVLVQAVVLATLIAAMPEKAMAFWQSRINRVLAANAAIALTFWIARMLSGAIPTPF